MHQWLPSRLPPSLLGLEDPTLPTHQNLEWDEEQQAWLPSSLDTDDYRRRYAENYSRGAFRPFGRVALQGLRIAAHAVPNQDAADPYNVERPDWYNSSTQRAANVDVRRRRE